MDVCRNESHQFEREGLGKSGNRRVKIQFKIRIKMKIGNGILTSAFSSC